jgi:hypothetical protein
MKTLLQLSILMIMAAAQVACSSGSSATTASTGTMTGGVCFSTAGTQVACNETTAANSGSQVVSPGGTVLNSAQVPSTSLLAASAQANHAIAQKVAQKSQEVQMQSQSMSSDPESANEGPVAMISSSAGTLAVSGSDIIESNISSSAHEMAALRAPASAPVSGVAEINNGASVKSGSSNNGNTVQ